MTQNQVLSQAEIDALLSARPGEIEVKPEEPPEEEEGPIKVTSPVARAPDPVEEEAPAPPQRERPLPPAEAPPAEERRQPAEVRAPATAPETSSGALETLVLELKQRMESVESLGQRIGALEKSVADIGAAAQAFRQSTQALVQHLAAQNARLQGLADNAQATPGHGLRKLFTCAHCASKEAVASRIKCTSCGAESWWGWWPKK